MIVVNFSTPNYARPQNRLKESLWGYRYAMYNEYKEIDSPTHQQSPYEFKLHTIDKGFEYDDIVLWVDSSFWRVGDLSKIEKVIKEDGYILEECGHYVDRWTNRHTKNYFNLAEGSGYTMFSAGMVGLNLKSELAMEFFYKWKQSAKAGCFKGSHADHRHDQSAGSIIASRLGMKYQSGGSYMAYIGEGYSAPNPDVVWYLQGMP